MSFEAIEAQQLPYLRNEVERLLRVDNGPYYRATADCAGALGPFGALSRHLDPNARVRLWRRVLEMTGGELPSCGSSWGTMEPKRQMILALASRASQSTGVDNSAALRDAEEAKQLADAIGSRETISDLLEEVRARVERFRSGAMEPEASLERVAGHYGMGLGMEGNRLTLRAEGTYESWWWSDALDPCHPGGRRTEGTVRVEGDTIVLSPGPMMRRHGIDAPDVLVPVSWGDRLDLVPGYHMTRFCRWVHSGAKGDWRGFYVRTPEAETPRGLDPAQCLQYAAVGE